MWTNKRDDDGHENRHRKPEHKNGTRQHESPGNDKKISPYGHEYAEHGNKIRKHGNENRKLSGEFRSEIRCGE